MKKTFTIILFFIAKISFSQNLVPNPSFEQYDTCPSHLDQMDYAMGWSAYTQSPDYYNSCAPYVPFPEVSVTVPANYYGYHYARTGNAYAGFVTFEMGVINAREYIGIQLIQPLIIGQKYFASCYVSRTENINFPNFSIATNKIGIRLSTIAYNQSNPEPTDNHAQVFSDSIITDTSNWVPISGSFIADSAYSYLSIGNFFDDTNTSYIRLDSVASIAYYYIDDVYLSVDSTVGISPINKNDFTNVFPNPARDWIVLEGSEIKSFSIFDALGRIYIEDASVITSLLKIDVSKLSSGIYFIRINTSKTSFNQKLVIQ